MGAGDPEGFVLEIHVPIIEEGTKMKSYLPINRRSSNQQKKYISTLNGVKTPAVISNGVYQTP